MDIKKRLGENLREIRKQKGWSQEKLAFECELDRTYISGIERGIRNPTIVILDKIAKILDVSLGTLVK